MYKVFPLVITCMKLTNGNELLKKNTIEVVSYLVRC
uniref:Uncharacterized protein n=1 Tax=Arundo donax TaxID=35708 RepID=A0A0A9G4X6_ARUDO